MIFEAGFYVELFGLVCVKGIEANGRREQTRFWNSSTVGSSPAMSNGHRCCRCCKRCRIVTTTAVAAVAARQLVHVPRARVAGRRAVKSPARLFAPALTSTTSGVGAGRLLWLGSTAASSAVMAAGNQLILGGCTVANECSVSRYIERTTGRSLQGC